jgi:glycosyltransferase involved in cell wall biosynthesis
MQGPDVRAVASDVVMLAPAPSRLLVVMIPAYNEAETISQTILDVLALRPVLAHRNLQLKVLVIDDGSRDATASLACDAGADGIITHHQNLGLGAAVRSGLEAAAQQKADIFLKIDADLQHNPTDIIAVADPILRNEADLVYGERFSKISYKMPLVRRVGNSAFRALMRWLTKWPIKDSQPGIFAVSNVYLSVHDVPGNYNYTQQILLDAYLKGMRFAQVPVEFNQRRAGRSFVSLSYPFRVLPQILLVLAMSKPMKIFGTCGFTFLFFGTSVFVFELCRWLFGYSEKPIMNVNLVLGTCLFGLQTLFFGILAQLVVLTRPRRNSGSH